jgi:hypothetical protein
VVDLGLPWELPLQESRKAQLRNVGLGSTAPSRGKALNLPKKVQEGAALIPIPSSRVQAEHLPLRYAAALPINSELTGDDSAAGA